MSIAFMKKTILSQKNGMQLAESRSIDLKGDKMIAQCSIPIQILKLEDLWNWGQP